MSSFGESRLEACRCYVTRLAPEARLTMRWGAHAVDCPAWRASLDPVDALHDELARAELQPKHDAAFQKRGRCEEWSVLALPLGDGSHVCSCDDSCEHRAGVHRCKDCFARWRVANAFTNRAQVVRVE